MSYVSPQKSAEYFNVTTSTLRRWANQKKISYTTTSGKHRRYKIPNTIKKNHKKKIIYARVSSQKQKEDLKRQIKYLKQKYPKHEVISDIGSGINFKRKGLLTILESVFKKNIQEVVVYSKDRFSRFGIELFRFIFEKFDSRLIFVHNKDEQTESEEIAEDILAIITVYSAKIHGKRKYKI